MTAPSIPPTNILVPIDFTDGTEAALDYACALASKLGATVHLVNALGAPLPDVPGELSGTRIDDITESHQVELARLANERRAVAPIGQLQVRPGNPPDAIVEAIDEVHADLVVMGTHARRGVKRIVLGSVAEEVTRRAGCPVLLVRVR